MASSEYGTEFAVMTKAAQSVRQAVEEINTEMRTLESNLAPVANAWKGSASAAFLQLMERMQADSAKLTQALDAIGEALSSNTTNYSQVEDENTTSITSLLKGLS
jgi:WXG100 family type VII secretion target